MQRKQIVVVLGMHRSGTSAITRGLQVLGINLGERLLPAETNNNEKGFWEDIDVTAFNVDLLAMMGHDWHTLVPIQPRELQREDIESIKLRAAQLLREKIANVERFGLKDPRISRLMPFWLEVFEHLRLDVSYVIACRNPMNVARSLEKRNGFALEKSYLLWYEHMLLSMQHTANARRVFVDYDLILSEPQQQLARIAASLDLPFLADSEDFAQYRNEFLETSLRHNAYAPEDLRLDSAAPTQVLQLHTILSDLCCERVEDSSQIKEQIANLCSTMEGRYPEYRLMRMFEDRGQNLQLRLDEAETIAANLAARANEVHSALAESNTLATQQYEHIEQQRGEIEHLRSDLQQLDEALAQSNAQVQQLDIALTQSNAQVQQLDTALAQSNAQVQQLDTALTQSNAQVQQLDIALTQSTLEVKQLLHALAVSRTGRAAVKSLIRATATRTGLARLQRVNLQRALKKSGLFDSNYYLASYPDVAKAGIAPLIHFLEQGWLEGRNPSPSFSTNAYLQRYPDVRAQGINPLVHYLRHGHREGRVLPTTSGDTSQPIPQRSVSVRILRLARLALAEPALVRKFMSEAHREGLRHALALARLKANRPQPHNSSQAVEHAAQHSLYNVVPYYLNPYQHDDMPLPPMKIGIHLHLYYPDMAEQCIAYLDNIPLPYDLFVSVPEHEDAAAWQKRFRSQLAMVQQVTVTRVPNRGRDLAPLIIEFGNKLVGYDVVAHFHTKKSPHKTSLSGWFDALMSSLCGTRSGVSQILALLADDAKVVFPAGHQVGHWDSSGWSDNRDIAKAVLEKYSKLNIADFPQVEFPQGSMFWGKGEALHEFLTLPLTYRDFAEEPIAADATLAHALERLILVFSRAHQGRNYRIESKALSDEPQQFYEEQFNFSGSIVHDSIKVLAYYLPQFHPTPENDAWHGKGFTEWHKVGSANPLFQGHFQQHIPHPDIGYYHLDSPARLAQQSEMMRQSGVHGLIFYHYWFSGKLILEKPAQMLLENPDIDMPFSFCWANENWTRRWDGNESEILLGQVYSPEDAVAFIRYLIPFFKDERYIRVEGRPLLFVYRPSAMEHVGDYLRLWREECQHNGLPAPYVVATLTRGATTPQDYGMDAAVERVLHDWTGGAVADIRHELTPYWPMNGSVLDYSEVADHYMHKELDNDYTLFRSLVPTWDNTARYGSEAILLHNFTTPKFQEWLEHLIRYSVTELPADRRFVVINAWNEWAEGAHLEPDTQFGYGYLNSIGRALSGYAFDDTHYLKPQPVKGRVLHLALDMSDEAKHHLASDGEARRKFIHCLTASSLLEKSIIQVDDPELANELTARGIRCSDSQGTEPEFRLRFEKLYLFPATCIESLLLMALRHPGFGISPSVLNDLDYLHNPHAVNFDINYWARAGMELTPYKANLRGHKVACKATCFHLPKSLKACGDSDLPQVSTIMRFHRKGNLGMLANALLSLAAQIDCRVKLQLAVQDLDDQDMTLLNAELARVPWSEGCEPIINRYYSSDSNPDLRSLMLNETLKAVGKGYTAFLDYDDILFPQAYNSLLKRLRVSGKNATFARVYATRVDARSGMILKRDKTYEYGFSYEEFIRLNHAPLHSFMLDLDRIDLSAVHYHDNMKFMEDYYLTLQLFTPKETDWASLRHCEYIGDYVHRVGDESNTLALHDEVERQALLKSEHYVVCEERITELRRSLTG